MKKTLALTVLGGLILAAANTLGASSLERRCAELMGPVEHTSKHKCRVIRAVKSAATLDEARLLAWREAGAMRRVEGALSESAMQSLNDEVEAGRILAPAAAHGARAQHIVLPTELVVRASCGQALHCAATLRFPPSNVASEGGARHRLSIPTAVIG